MISRAALSSVAGLFLGIAIVMAGCAGGAKETSDRSVAPGETGAEVAQEAVGSISGSAPGAAPAAPAALTLDRKIIENISLDLQVEDVSQAFERVKAIADGAGGFVLDSSRTTQDPPQADVTIRVPSAASEGVLEQLRGLAVKVEKENSKAQDVTEEYTDLQARLRNSRAVEAQYLDMLNQAKSIPDMLSIQDRLTQVRLEIEQLQGQANAIDTLSSLATISVHLHTEPVVEQPQKSDLDPLAAAGHGWEASLTFLRAVAAGTLAVGAFLWWAVPLVVVGGLVSLFFVRRARSTSAKGGS